MRAADGVHRPNKFKTIHRRGPPSTILLTLAVLFGPPLAASPLDPYDTLKVERPRVSLAAPEVQASGLDQSAYRLADFRGKVVLLHFWATFCAPCRHELPALERLWRRFQPSGLIILAVSADRGNRDYVSRFVREQGLSFPIVLDPDGEVRTTYEVFALPLTYIIGRDGKILGRVVGNRNWDEPAATNLIRRLLSKEQSP